MDSCDLPHPDPVQSLSEAANKSSLLEATNRSQELIDRQNSILDRIARLEVRFAETGSSASGPGPVDTTAASSNGRAQSGTADSPAAGAPASPSANRKVPPGQPLSNGLHADVAFVSETQLRLENILRAGGATDFKFVRVPSDYYEQSYETRRDLLGAASVEHLCKSIVMVNTQAAETVVDCSDPKNSKYYVVVSQYAAKLNAEKVRQFVHGLNEGRIPKKRFNMRLAPEHDSDTLTGFEHNAVTPIGMRTPIPVILSEAIARLEPDFFWLGGGEVDLKLGVKTSEFIRVVKPFIVDC